MIPRRTLPKDEWDVFVRSRFCWAPGIKGTDREEEAYRTLDALAEAMSREVLNRGLSPIDDIHVMFDFCRIKTVGVNFCGNTQVVAEDIAYELLQQKPWSDHGVVISAGRDEEMIEGAESEIVTNREIVMAVRVNA